MSTSTSIFDLTGLTYCTGQTEDERIGNHVWGDVSGKNANFTETKTVYLMAKSTAQRLYIFHYIPKVTDDQKAEIIGIEHIDQADASVKVKPWKQSLPDTEMKYTISSQAGHDINSTFVFHNRYLSN